MSFYDFLSFDWVFKAGGMRRASFDAPTPPAAAPAAPKMRTASFGGTSTPTPPKPGGATPGQGGGKTSTGQDASQWHEIPSMPGRQVRFVGGEREVRPMPSAGGTEDKPKEEGASQGEKAEPSSGEKAKLSGGVDELTRGLSGALNARGQSERLRLFNQAKVKVDQLMSTHTEGKTDDASRSIKNMLGNIRMDIGELMSRGARMSEGQRRGKVDNLQRKMSRLRNMDTASSTVSASRKLELLEGFLHKCVEDLDALEKESALSSFGTLGDMLE